MLQKNLTLLSEPWASLPYQSKLVQPNPPILGPLALTTPQLSLPYCLPPSLPLPLFPSSTSCAFPFPPWHLGSTCLSDMTVCFATAGETAGHSLLCSVWRVEHGAVPRGAGDRPIPHPPTGRQRAGKHLWQGGYGRGGGGYSHQPAEAQTTGQTRERWGFTSRRVFTVKGLIIGSLCFLALPCRPRDGQ